MMKPRLIRSTSPLPWAKPLPSSFLETWENAFHRYTAKGTWNARRIAGSTSDIVLAERFKAVLAYNGEILDISVIKCVVMDLVKYGHPTKNIVSLSITIPFEFPINTPKNLRALSSRIGVFIDFPFRPTLESHLPLPGFTASMVQNRAETGAYFTYAEPYRHAPPMTDISYFSDFRHDATTQNHPGGDPYEIFALTGIALHSREIGIL